MAGGKPLTDQQVRFFRTFGFLRVPGLFADDIEAITSAFETVFTNDAVYRVESSDVKVHGFRPRTTIPWFIDQHPTLAALRDDPRIVGVARSLLGDEFAYAESDGNLFSCDTEWHCDIYAAPMSIPHIKVSFYLDRLTSDSGAPRLIPGTHYWTENFAVGLRKTFDNNVGALAPVFGIDGPRVPGVVLETEPGDLLIWDFRTIHASYNSIVNRRLFTINFRQGSEGGSARAPEYTADRRWSPVHS
jgi:Phytanoyl-CoA dioxygenase (PhyH)